MPSLHSLASPFVQPHTFKDKYKQSLGQVDLCFFMHGFIYKETWNLSFSVNWYLLDESIEFIIVDYKPVKRFNVFNGGIFFSKKFK